MCLLFDKVLKINKVKAFACQHESDYDAEMHMSNLKVILLRLIKLKLNSQNP